MLGDITSCDIKVMRTGEKKDTAYTFVPEATSPIAESIIKEYEEKKVNFEERFIPPDANDLKKLMAGATFDEVYGNNQNTSSNDNTTDEEVNFVV